MALPVADRPLHGNEKFKVVEEVVDPDGVVAVITERVKDGRISFMISREFEVDGKTQRSAYLNTRHIPAVQQLLADLAERLELAEDRAREKKRERG